MSIESRSGSVETSRLHLDLYLFSSNVVLPKGCWHSHFTLALQCCESKCDNSGQVLKNHTQTLILALAPLGFFEAVRVRLQRLEHRTGLDIRAWTFWGRDLFLFLVSTMGC